MFKYFSILLFLTAQLTLAQYIEETETNYSNGLYATEVKVAKMRVEKLMADKKIPGLSIAVAKKGKIIWAEGFGYIDLENKIPVRLNSKFRIGSISKSLTSIALGKLVEEKKIHFDDSVHKYVSYFPEKRYPITLKELASHTSGIRNYDYKNGEYFSTNHYNTVEESIDIFKNDSLLFEPKTKYSYSTYGYVLLSAVIEAVSEQNFLEFMHDSIIEPMGMYNTVPDFNDSIIPNRTSFYHQKDGLISNARFVDNSNKWAGGGYLSTSLDLVKMAQIILEHNFISKATVEKLWTPNILSDGEKTNYCLGWRKNKDNLGRDYIHHGGSSVGGRSFLLIYPKEKVAIAITSNMHTRFNEIFALEIIEEFIK